ncbi:glycosyltransferase [Vibrio variabilis]|uniref:glycosyltransferase n=1 Tax=Vibrio variabilis TaxID=990271 RepID=UPI001EFA1056|nr:glycosyltransferase [Vibrio variabilis]
MGVHQSNLARGESKRSTIWVAKLNALLSRFVPDRIIYCAEKARSVQEDIGYVASKGAVVQNGYDVDDFAVDMASRATFRQQLALTEHEFLVGHVGRYHPFKDYPTLTSAINTLVQSDVSCTFTLVGHELTRENKDLMEQLTDESKKAVKLLGRRSDVPAVMNGMDLFVLSSASEAFPNVLNEAMACGTPCVTTDVGDAA